MLKLPISNRNNCHLRTNTIAQLFHPVVIVGLAKGGYMARGEVKWFNNAKGWGFIIPEGGGEDIFVHFSSIDGTGYKTLVPGQKVTYEVAKGDRGLHASNVIALAELNEQEMA